MRISLSADSARNVVADLLVVGVMTNRFDKGEAAQLNKALGGGLPRLSKDEGFEAKSGQTLKVPGTGKLKAKWVVFVGIDGKDANEHARVIGHAAAKAARRQKSAALLLTNRSAASVRAASNALVLGTYRYVQMKTKKEKSSLNKAAILVPKASAELKAAVQAGIAVAESINFARDLVNGPPNVINPVTLANAAKKEATKLNLRCTIWGKKQLQKLGMNLFLAVNRGSAIEPRFIHLVYKPRKKNVPKVAFVGKGLTFDAGGLCLKPAKSMLAMKCDMAGAATTLGVILAAARLKLPVEVHALVGSTENMTGADAYRPSDVFKSYDGKTVEIINTDAEGRLVLADVLAWTRDNVKPDIIVDHATLTGACMVALGAHRAALYTDDEKLAKAYQTAAKTADEKLWRMPLDKDLRSTLDSPIADIKHTGAPYGGSITAALFLREFVGKVPWMHLDIAGPAFLDGPHGRAPKGGTGFGVATGVRFLESL